MAKKQATKMRPVRAVAKEFRGHGFERVMVLPGSTYADNSTVVVIPTRGMIHHKVVSAWQGLMTPMNQKRAIMFAAGHEVGQAYDAMIKTIIAHPELSKWKYVLTLEDDNLPPMDAHIRLLETIEYGKFDAVSGIYFTKGPYNMAMAYGDPAEYKRTGVLDFRPRDVRAALEQGNVMPVNGIAMGCALWRLEMFKQLPPPWFVSVSDLTPDGPAGWTQDLYFCNTAIRAGKTFAVDLRVKVGHMDVATEEVY
jgi:hypothetical protein